MKKTVAKFSPFNEGQVVELPQYQTAGSVGVDLKANITEPVVLYPFFRRVIPTGLKVTIKEGYEGQVRPRSGLAANNGITVLNAPGTIDSDFSGHIQVILYNSDHAQTFTVNPGDRIAQMVFAPVAYADCEKVAKKRGIFGFGSTGKE